MTKLKFGGISFGGIAPTVKIYGNTYILKFGKNKKTYGFNIVKKKKRNIIFARPYLLFPFLDLFMIISWFGMLAIINSGILDSMTENINVVSETIGINLFALAISIYLTFAFFHYPLMCYFLAFKGVRKWHGLEHKLIESAKKNDLFNCDTCSPISERCGGTLMPTIFLASFIWGYIMMSLSIYPPFGQCTFMSLFIFLNIKYFHKYDIVGIWFGKALQKYVTVKEPDNWQLDLGTIAMENLYLAETGKEYLETGVVDLDDSK